MPNAGKASTAGKQRPSSLTALEKPVENILMVSAENGALPGGKVGGIGDVVRDIPPALAAQGYQVHVVTPGYQSFTRLPGAEHSDDFTVQFAGDEHAVALYRVPAINPDANVCLWALEHPRFAAGGAGNIYCDDPPDRPYSTDATKFALFSVAVAEAIKRSLFGDLQVLHLHDWHAALVAVLRAYDPEYQSLQSIHTVYTIHNLALQGIRPLADDDSSMQSWFPNLMVDVNAVNDPRAPHCVNPMRAGINLADKVHAVSPTYATEIVRPSQAEVGIYGGEGLEADLQVAAEQGRLFGILNGCDYSAAPPEEMAHKPLLALCEKTVIRWLASQRLALSSHLIALHRIEGLLKQQKSMVRKMLLTSVGRITDQKLLLLRETMPNGKTALVNMLEMLGNDGLFVLLGSGDSKLEDFCTSVAGEKANFLFLNGYSDPLAQALYASGDLFVMPSSFEPCGISQMLAMRSGQPCLVHAVGGLKDTVEDEVNGFAFTGDNVGDQASNMLERFNSLLEMKRQDPERWMAVSAAAAQARFSWSAVAVAYKSYLYTS